ncbi:MAG TPA: hypothetical protein VIS48_03665 [Candidatus Kryptonia bacterium]
MKMFVPLVGCLLFAGCCLFSSSSEGSHDVQFVQIFLHTGALDELDTFHGTYQKDLIPGTVKTTMWLTTREQEIIATALERYKFFSLPDTIYKFPANETISPNLGTQVLRVKYNGKDKTVVWDSGLELATHNKYKYFIESITQLIGDIVASKPEYKALPPAKGGYQ